MGRRVRGLSSAAERLGLKPTTLQSRMVRLGIARDQVLEDALPIK
jgi:transcriptional regulator with GAF, ATPase, and Fis domain